MSMRKIWSTIAHKTLRIQGQDLFEGVNAQGLLAYTCVEIGTVCVSYSTQGHMTIIG